MCIHQNLYKILATYIVMATMLSGCAPVNPQHPLKNAPLYGIYYNNNTPQNVPTTTSKPENKSSNDNPNAITVTSSEILELDFTLLDVPKFTFNLLTGELFTFDINNVPRKIILKPINKGWGEVFPLKVADNDGNLYKIGLSKAAGDNPQLRTTRVYDMHLEQFVE